MTNYNTIELEVKGSSAMFTDSRRSTSREKVSLPVPTYEAIKGILKQIYWKPTFIWVVDEVRIMNEILTETYSVKYRRDASSAVMEISCLKNVCYQVRAHFIWNENRPEFKADRIDDKHFGMALNYLNKGGKFGVYLGTSECPAYVKSMIFGSGRSFYDNSGVMDFGEIYHGMTYPDEGWNELTRSCISRRKWHCIAKNGIIGFPPPERCSAEFLRKAEKKSFGKTESLTGV